MLTKNFKTIAITLIMLLTWPTVVPAATLAAQELVQSYTPVGAAGAQPLAAPPAGDYIIEGTGEGVACRDATHEESQALAGRDQVVSLHVISPIRQDGVGPQDATLNIILRGTQQLENFPQAKSAFLRAAQTWESIIQNGITVIIDVDYGPTRFGIPYPNPNILGSTFSQPIGNTSLYTTVRNSLAAQASSTGEAELYNALPVGAVQTDLGSTAALLAPSPLYRALGIIGPVADPASETSTLGSPPAIGFNSAFQFDFDPDNGIDAGKTDFDAVAVHEIGHALGFVSNVGARELDPGGTVAPSLLDLLRFRPGITLATFSNAWRLQSSGGAQVFFAGGAELALSTGRPDITGGDGRQASHWKDDALSGQYLGIMDPTIPSGQRWTLTNNDLAAFDSIGYQLRNAGGDTVSLSSGVSQTGSVSAPNPGAARVSPTQYSVEVPNSATELRIDLSGNQDVDLFVRFDQRVAPDSSGLPIANYKSDSPSGEESITVTSSSAPPLKSGTYYIAVANYGPGAASFTVTATVIREAGGNNAPQIISLQAELSGDELTLSGTAFDPDGDITHAQSDLLNSAGQKVGQTEPFPVNLGGLSTVNFRLQVTNLNALPAAILASLIFIDSRGNRSGAATADFSGRDSGGPTVSNASYTGSKLVVKGSGFASQLLIEINGQVVAILQSTNSRKLKLNRDPGRLNLRTGPNRLRIYDGDLRSNLFVLNF